jgi:hypothetical protein
LGDGASVNGIVFSVRADKFREHDLPAEIECGDQPVVSASDFKAGTITIEPLGFRGGVALRSVALALIGATPPTL